MRNMNNQHPMLDRDFRIAMKVEDLRHKISHRSAG
jgi:hypothetical protein